MFVEYLINDVKIVNYSVVQTEYSYKVASLLN